jgi:transposase-like protein
VGYNNLTIKLITKYMSKRRLTTAQITELSQNKNVSKCSAKSITYSKAFKVLAVKKYYEEGYSSRMIFEEAGFDRQLIGLNVPDGCLNRWRKIYKSKGEDRLKVETRGKHSKSGRPKTRGVTDADKIKRMKIEIAYLKAENDFLVKLRAVKKR